MRMFPLLQPSPQFRDVKDPCPVWDGARWHIFGSGGDVTTETWRIYHATAPSLEGPWTEEQPVETGIGGSGVAAPGVLCEDGRFVMFVQTEFLRPGGTVEFLTSPDGFAWTRVNTALRAIDGSCESGVYDPHPARIGGDCYLVYSGMAEGWPPKPDVYLAKSASGRWEGPWLRLGRILDHADVAEHHNQPDHPDYEWGIEGAQLLQLPDGRILLNATSFLPTGARGGRQRVFFAFADDVRGPYRSAGPVLEPASPGENGHSTALLIDGEVVLCYQARKESTGRRWRYGLARFGLDPGRRHTTRPAAAPVLETAVAEAV